MNLEEDLSRAFAVATWSSAAGLYALIMGVPLICAFPAWIGAQAGISMNAWLERSAPFESATGRFKPFPDPLNRNDDDRLAVFHRLAWAQWELSEIQNGKAFRYLLNKELD